MMTNFVVCGCRFTNHFFCKNAARGPLVYWWYHWKIFAVNFYASCFDSREKSIGKKLIRLDWGKTVYRPLFTLANTLYLKNGEAGSDSFEVSVFSSLPILQLASQLLSLFERWWESTNYTFRLEQQFPVIQLLVRLFFVASNYICQF